MNSWICLLQLTWSTTGRLSLPFAVALPGVGSSTLAVHLAIGMSAHDRQAVLVDADLQKASATALAGIDCPTGATIVEMLASWRTAAEILQTGPGGIRILPGDVRGVGSHHLPANAPDRFAAEIDRLAEDSGVVVVDAGFGLTPWNANLWRLADVVLVVTTPEERSILATYTMLKMAAHYGALSKVRIAVNRVGELGLAQEVRRRLGETCFRFLGELVPGFIPAARKRVRHSYFPGRRAQFLHKQLLCHGDS